MSDPEHVDPLPRAPALSPARPGERCTASYRWLVDTLAHFDRLRGSTRARPSLALECLWEPLLALLAALRRAAETVCAFASGVPRRTEHALADGLDQFESEQSRNALERLIWAVRLSNASVEGVEHLVYLTSPSGETDQSGLG